MRLVGAWLLYEVVIKSEAQPNPALWCPAPGAEKQSHGPSRMEWSMQPRFGEENCPFPYTLIHALTTSPAIVLSASGTCQALFPPQSVCILFSMTFPECHTPAPSCHAHISLNVISSKSPDLTDRHTYTCRHRHTHTHVHTHAHTHSLSHSPLKLAP